MSRTEHELPDGALRSYARAFTPISSEAVGKIPARSLGVYVKLHSPGASALVSASREDPETSRAFDELQALGFVHVFDVGGLPVAMVMETPATRAEAERQLEAIKREGLCAPRS